MKHIVAGNPERGYDSLEALLAAESNGWVVVAVVTKGKKVWPAVEGPYDSKREAQKAASRIRGRWKRTAQNYPGTTYRIHVRSAWKELF